jgi:hypothetical protein
MCIRVATPFTRRLGVSALTPRASVVVGWTMPDDLGSDRVLVIRMGNLSRYRLRPRSNAHAPVTARASYVFLARRSQSPPLERSISRIAWFARRRRPRETDAPSARSDSCRTGSPTRLLVTIGMGSRQNPNRPVLVQSQCAGLHHATNFGVYTALTPTVRQPTNHLVSLFDRAVHVTDCSQPALRAANYHARWRAQVGRSFECPHF